MKNFIIDQEYHRYSEEDHAVWQELTRRQSLLSRDRISKEYLYGLESLSIDRHRIVNIPDLSRKMFASTGWRLVPVQGLIPADVFFTMIIDKVYPVTVPVRQRSELDFSEQPDIFHDIFGHLPLLLHRKFSDFLVAYSKIAINYIHNPQAVEFLARFYWYTYEMGLILEDNAVKAYGGALITSATEIDNVRSTLTHKHPFNVERMFHTPYNPYKLQNEYFVIEDYISLFHSLQDLESKVEHQLEAVSYEGIR